ncbi:Hint domain-containing protein [Aliiroseovarius crassostreae]|uniref:Hint domain-containing protein n=1 Tax=Aliiroseovarius crassostreae TaxID=154981 RepID=UPI0021FCAFA4|nr:Hint domain-containing protein [Aliiroseovarius crassostreae]UWQ00951.1 Hint domain-containing protein [Aliiroseovarius crassostreae]
MSDPYISEVKYLGAATLDFVEIAVESGTDVSDLVVTIYNADGTVRSTNSLDGLNYTTVNGKDVYVVESGSPSTFSGLHKFGGVSLSDSSTLYNFISFSDNASTITATEGPASGQTSTDIGVAGSGASLETTDGGATYVTQTSPSKGTIPCLTKGVRVRTDRGDVKVEDLEPGMRVASVDGGHITLRKLLSRKVCDQEIRRDIRLAPVRIRQGVLGNNLPTRDLLVSRQHRMLVSSPIVKRMFGEENVLVAAIRLTDLPGISVDDSVMDVTYYHLLFDRHCIIFAEDAPTESLFVDRDAMSCLPSDVIAELSALFPHFRATTYVPKPARHIPDGKRQKKLMQRHAKNACLPLLSYKAPIPGSAKASPDPVETA